MSARRKLSAGGHVEESGSTMKTTIGTTEKMPGKKRMIAVGTGEMGILRRNGIPLREVLPIIKMAKELLGCTIVGAKGKPEGDA